MRLTRSRKGKTAVDITAVEQNGLKRVRLTLGETDSSNKRNTDMDDKEIENLIVMLQFNLLKLRGEVPWELEE